MKDVLDKLSSYNIFNYLLPGTLFVVIAEATTPYRFRQHDLVLDLFVYYFAGLVISRLGSLIVEPLLKKFKIVDFAPYGDYVKASKKDAMLEVLSEANNTYRTLVALPMSLLLLLVAEWSQPYFGITTGIAGIVLLVILLLLFVFSYRKQTNYIAARVMTLNK